VGIFETGISEVDGAMAILAINRVQKTLNYQRDQATLIALILNDQRQVKSVQKQLIVNQAFASTEILSWQQSQPNLAGIIAIDKGSNYISQFLIALLIAAGILNTMLMSVLERQHEFGVMMALGMKASKLFRLVMVESFWLTMLGLIIGIIISIPWYLYMHQTGIDLSGAYGNNMDYGGVLLDPVLKIRLFQESVAAILISLFILALSSAAYPAWRAGQTPIIDSLKNN